MAGTAPINSFFPTKARATRQTTKRKGIELQDEDERDWTPSKRVKVGKGKAVEGTPASGKKKAAHEKQSRLAFGLQTPASSVASPQPSSSRSRRAGGEGGASRIHSAVDEYDLVAGLPTPQATGKKGKATRATRAHSEVVSGPSKATRAASPILISSSSLDHISPPPATKAKRPARPLRHSGSIIELTSSEEEDMHDNPFMNRDAKLRSRSPDYELPHLSGPLSPLTQQSSMDSRYDNDLEFKVPELPSRMRDAPVSHPYSQAVPSSQSQEVFGGPSSLRQSSPTSPSMATSPLLDTTDMRCALPSSPAIVPSSQTQELPSMIEASPSQPSSSLPPSSAPIHSSQSESPMFRPRDIQPMLLSPLLNSPSSSLHARMSPRNTPHKYSQVESSQMEEIELERPPSPSSSNWVPTPRDENSPPRQRTSPAPLPTTSPSRKTPASVKRDAAVAGPSARVDASLTKTPSKSPAKATASSHPPTDSPTQDEVPTPPRPHNPYTDSPTQEETPIKSQARARNPVVDDSPTQEEVTQSTPYKRRPHTDMVPKKRTSPLKPRAQSVAEDSDSDTELHGQLPALRFGASQPDSDADDGPDVNRPGPSSQATPARVSQAPSFVYTGSGHRSRTSSQKSKQASQGQQSQNEVRRPAPPENDSQDAFFNPRPSTSAIDSQAESDFGSFVGSIDSDLVDYMDMEVDQPSFDLHTQHLLPVKSVLDKRDD